MEINVGILIAQAVNFLVLLGLFKWLIGDKLTKAIVARRAELSKAHDATKIYEETLSKAEAEKKALIDEGVAHKNQLVEEAAITAQQKAEHIIAQADKTAESVVKKAEEKAQKMSADLEETYVEGVKSTARLLVKKLIGTDEKLKEAYMDELAQEFVK